MNTMQGKFSSQLLLRLVCSGNRAHYPTSCSTALKTIPKMDWKDFHSYETMMDYVNFIGRHYPDIAEVENIGKTYEGRDLRLIRIGHGKTHVFIDAGASFMHVK